MGFGMTRRYYHPKTNRVPRLDSRESYPLGYNAFIFSDDINDWIKSPYIRNKEKERNTKK